MPAFFPLERDKAPVVVLAQEIHHAGCREVPGSHQHRLPKRAGLAGIFDVRVPQAGEPHRQPGRRILAEFGKRVEGIPDRSRVFRAGRLQDLFCVGGSREVAVGLEPGFHTVRTAMGSQCPNAIGNPLHRLGAVRARLDPVAEHSNAGRSEFGGKLDHPPAHLERRLAEPTLGMMEEAAGIDAAHGHARIAQAAPGLPQAAAGELRPLPQPVVGLDEPQLNPIEPELDGGVQNAVQGPGRAR